MPGTSGPSRSSCPKGSPARRAAGARSSARTTSSTSGSTRARATRRCCRSARSIAGRRTSISRAATSIAAGSTARCWWASARAGRAPFDQVLTHGFVVDEQGRKMSKSLGNTIAPQDVIKQSGADILRLWVSMVDYREDIRLGKEILARTVEAYRKFRNVIRVLVANLYDFDPLVDVVCPRTDAGNRSVGDGAVRRRAPSRSSRPTTSTTTRRSSRRRTRSSPWT